MQAVDGKAYLVRGNGKSSLDKPFTAPPSKFIVLDAPCSAPTTAGELEPGHYFLAATLYGGHRLMLRTKDGVVYADNGDKYMPPPNTLDITGPIYRPEVEGRKDD